MHGSAGQRPNRALAPFRVPPFVHDSFEVRVGHLLDEPERVLVDGIVIGTQELCVGNDRATLVRTVGVARVRILQRQAEPLRPARRGPGLLGSGDGRDVVVLDPGQVPYESGDRIRPIVEA
jgi:hypothetical protein